MWEFLECFSVRTRKKKHSPNINLLINFKSIKLFRVLFPGMMLALLNKNMTVTVYSGICTNIAMAFTTGKKWVVFILFFSNKKINSTETDTKKRLIFYLFFFFNVGMSWPLEGAHHILKAVNWAIPMTLPVEAAQAISSKSFSITHPLITTGFISCIAWSVIFGLIVYVFSKYKKNIWFDPK